MTKKVLNEEPMNMVQVKDALSRIRKRDGELNYRANRTEDYVNNICLLSAKQADELFKKLESLKIPRLREQQLHKIVDIMPKTSDMIKAVMQGFNISITNDNAKKIVDVVKDFSK